ncbi:hypothetical protein ACSBR2_018313 [Camellia fascicularis]
MIKEKNSNQLHQFGGAKGMAGILETNEKDGIKGNDAQNKMTSGMEQHRNGGWVPVDVFIPSKRRLVSHSRFGFVRFDYHVAVDIAIQKGNGLLVDDKVLEVKNATLHRRNREEHNRRNPPSIRKSQFIRRSFEVNRSRGHVSSAGQRSFVDVLQGVKTNTSIKVTEEGNG